VIVTLQAGNASVALAGGKGANLARLLGAGFSVPGGFIITTRAYNEYVAANNLENWIVETAQSARPGDPATLDEASTAIRARFDAGVIPPMLADAIGHAYASIGCPPVAVRSSATTEDLPEPSFAGQQDTFLNVTCNEALLKAVVRCWSSLWTARAIAYRTRNQIEHQDAALAVVVQEMVESETAGVLKARRNDSSSAQTTARPRESFSFSPLWGKQPPSACGMAHWANCKGSPAWRAADIPVNPVAFRQTNPTITTAIHGRWFPRVRLPAGARVRV
jgi:phosphoenolpyruvate synthase/pyruvate phosphate dikinase